MAAVIVSLPEPWAPTYADRRLRLVQPSRPVRPDARVFRRRRSVALLAIVAIALGATTVGRLALTGPGGGALTSPRPAGAPYVVQPGDTLWSIVVAHSRSGDPRPEVARLALQLGGRTLQPGQLLELP